MSTLLDVVSAVLVLSGSVIALVAAIGLHRLPDLYARMHAATKPATLGISLCLSGAALQVERVGDVTKVLLAIALQLLTNPVGAHLLGRAAHRAGAAQAPTTVLDELGEP
jgi:multicomponent Na+:H+ antiporter subunit G